MESAEIHGGVKTVMSGSVDRFEDLIAWQKARILTGEIYRISKAGAFAKDFALSNQIQRAAVSVMSNIAEGFERVRYGEFQHFLATAKGSCGELRSQLYIALDVGYISKADFNRLAQLSEEVGRIISGLRTSVLKLRSDRGEKV